VLARINAFEPYSCFTRIDRGNAGVVTSRDIVDFVLETKENGAGFSEAECNYVIKYFDSQF